LSSNSHDVLLHHACPVDVIFDDTLHYHHAAAVHLSASKDLVDVCA
jgi:hypothetical protein